MSTPSGAANKVAEEGELPVAHMVRYEDGREVLFKHCEVAEGIAKSNNGVHIRLYDRASRQVANKAEVDLPHWYNSPQSALGGKTALEGYRANPAYAHLYPVATPPATTGGALATPTGASTAIELDAYDAGLLSDFGGGDVSWWQDYIRAELGRAHDFYQSQVEGSVGASTVLTDERIHEIMSENVDCSYQEGLAFARAIEREVAAQAGQVAVPADMTAAADFIDKRAEQYLQDHASHEPDTGAISFHYGEAGRDYHSTLVELADDLRQASKPAACAVPPVGWNCTRAAGHEGPCAAAPSPAKESK